MSEPVIPFNFYPVKFNIPELECDPCTTGEYCQKVQQDDPIQFQFTMSECGDELIVCGDFATQICTTDNWTTGGGASILGWYYVVSGGVLGHTVGSTSPVGQYGILTAGYMYKVTFTVKRLANPLLEIEGTIQAFCGTTGGTIITQSGTYVQYIVSNGVDFEFQPSIDFDGGIDDVSVVRINSEYIVAAYDSVTGEIVGSNGVPTVGDDGIANFYQLWSSFELEDGCYFLKILDACEIGTFNNQVVNGGFFNPPDEWTFGANWSYNAADLKACHAGIGAGAISQTLPLLIPGLFYIVRVTVTDMISGLLDVKLGGTTIETITANGVYEITGQCGALDSDITFQANFVFDGCIDDVQVLLAPQSYPDSFRSNCFDLREEHLCTSVLSWTNDDNAFGADYETNWSPGGYLFPRVRLPITLSGITYPREVTRHRFSTGRRKKLRAVVDKTKTLHVDQIPEYLTDALALAMTHDHFYIDGVEYDVLDGDPEMIEIKGHALYNMSFDVQPQGENLVNSNCS